MGTGGKGHTYVLILEDEFSGYVWLTACEGAAPEVVANALISRFSSFGVVCHLVSDNRIHFKNELVKLLREQVRAEHHFTFTYCPCSNGTVEVLC